MIEQNHSKPQLRYSKIKNHNLSHIVKKWQAFIQQKKEQNQIHKNLQEYLQCPISSPSFVSSPKVKHTLSHSIGPTIRERSVIRQKYTNRNKKKTLKIQDFDDTDIRNSSQSFEMVKNKSSGPQKQVSTLVAFKRSLNRLPQNNFYSKDKRHKSLPSQINHNQALLNSEYIKKILKKFHKYSQQMKQQNCESVMNSEEHSEFRKYNQDQPIHLFDSKTSFSVYKSKNYFSNQIKTKTRIQSNIKSSASEFQKINQKRSIQISPWQIHQECS